VSAFNTVGYRTTHAPAGGRDRHELGGLTDAAFTTIAALECKRTAPGRSDFAPSTATAPSWS
jgi:hypothetical protein